MSAAQEATFQGSSGPRPPESARAIAIMAEVKYATPAEGDLGLRGDPGTLAGYYEAQGAAAVSCLTEPEFFKGDLDFLARIRRRCSLPILMKDFIVDVRQLQAGRYYGADAALLISEMLSLEELARLLRGCHELGLQALVEAHTAAGLARAVELEAGLIAINSRDLSTLQLDHRRHAALAADLPAGAVKVAASGISSRENLHELRALGYDAALIGRALARPGGRREILPCG